MRNTSGLRKMRLCQRWVERLTSYLLVTFLLVFSFSSTFVLSTVARAQEPAPTAPTPPPDIFKLERVEVEGGAELLTIHARLDGTGDSEERKWVPMVTVLRDTLGDLNPENDRLRYVWPLSYTHPTLRQRLSGAVPFLYTRVGNKSPSDKAPPPILDLAAPGRDVWNKIFWAALQNLLLDPYGMPIKASSRSYQHNISDYRKSHVIRALSVLSLYEALEGQSAFTETEMADIQARLRLTDKTFGGLVGDLHLQNYNDKQRTLLRDVRGHNWELLRQRAEAESLIFEPLEMPDGSVTHAILWTSREDLKANQGKKYDSRFLNIADPWSDKRLLSWDGFIDTRTLDTENRPVPADAPNARTVEMIPLALYGLDDPKIPMVLVDFRDRLNPKKREMSRRVLEDVTRNVVSLSRFGDLPYLLGRTVFDVVTGRRGIDINQPSRLRTYSQLKLLLSLNQSLDPELRAQIGNRLEKVSLNPMENDLESETRIAVQQYEALLAYARRPDGLARKLDRDRREEMVALEHGRTDRVLFRLANILSFGKYTHREKSKPEMEAKLDTARRLNYHTRFLQQVAKSGPQIEVTWDLIAVKRSLQFIVDHAQEADSGSASATAKIFVRTQDAETRRFCLESLSRMTNPKARSELQRLSVQKDLDQATRDLIASYLKTPPPSNNPLAVSNQKSDSGSSAH